MDIPLLEQVKIQAQVLVPLVKALQSELGEERANALVRSALGAQYRNFGDRWWRSRTAGDFADKMTAAFEWFAGGDALDYDVVQRGPEAFGVDVTRCRYAQFFQALGAPELGFLLVCHSDFAMTEGFPGVELQRTQTLMQGGSHCDFRYSLRKKDPAP
ncbi:MAG TPA: L-2-amino-thiazoline-4-carboxylic acid hydrolase [Kofleriaceae bacterium]|nr:L-2-amino-thiazoline-4-carboxylic acid hydrolase [Kofleriaceae bacterium]